MQKQNLSTIERSRNIPQLRFSEFSEDWKKYVIGDIANKITDGTHDTPKPVNKGIPFLTAIHVRDGFIDFDNCYFLPEDIHRKIYDRCNPEKDDLLMVNIGAGVATSARVNVNFEFSLKNVALIKPDKTKINPIFFTQIQRRNSARLKHQISSGGAQPFLSLKEIGKLKLIIPNSLPEQTKIATFLTAVDKRIKLLQKKKAELEQYKKGVMQKLFVSNYDENDDYENYDGKKSKSIKAFQKNHSSRQLRFKNEDGSDFDDWEVKKLGEVGEIINGLTYSPKNINTKGVLVLRSSNVKNRTLKFDDNVFVLTESFNPVKENDILICVRNGSKRLIGKNVIIDKENEGVAFGAFMTVYRSTFNSFLYHWFDTDEYKKEVHKNLGATINSINGSDLKKFKVPFPSKQEQQKIANFLSSIDKSIENITHQIDDSVIFKKGLLQKMFV